MPNFDAAYWDDRYRSSDSVWGAAPNLWVEQEVRDLPPGVAADLACGEGRNAAWLGHRGWRVFAVDFSKVGLDKGAAGVAGTEAEQRVTWVLDDAVEFRSPEPLDLAMLIYLQVAAPVRRAAVRNAAAALAPGGTLLVVAHDSRNLADGTGGPQNPDVLYTALDVADDLAPLGLELERAEEVLRPVDGAERPAIDALVRARRSR